MWIYPPIYMSPNQRLVPRRCEIWWVVGIVSIGQYQLCQNVKRESHLISNGGDLMLMLSISASYNHTLTTDGSDYPHVMQPTLSMKQDNRRQRNR